jgi:hypothetical protein
MYIFSDSVRLNRTLSMGNPSPIVFAASFGWECQRIRESYKFPLYTPSRGVTWYNAVESQIWRIP